MEEKQGKDDELVNSLVLMLCGNTAGQHHHIISGLIRIYCVRHISALHYAHVASVLTITTTGTSAPKTQS